MPIPDDEQFEHYLKQFRPLDPEPLPIEKYSRVTRRRFVLAVWAAAAVAVLAMVLLATLRRPKSAQLARDTSTFVSPEQLTKRLPLTIGTANALLARSPSAKATLDQMVFQPQFSQIPKGKHSAFAVLSKENTKL